MQVRGRDSWAKKYTNKSSKNNNGSLHHIFKQQSFYKIHVGIHLHDFPISLVCLLVGLTISTYFVNLFTQLAQCRF